MSLKFGEIRPWTTELAGFISYLQVTMIYIRARMSLKFGEIRPWTTELAALERL